MTEEGNGNAAPTRHREALEERIVKLILALEQQLEKSTKLLESQQSLGRRVEALEDANRAVDERIAECEKLETTLEQLEAALRELVGRAESQLRREIGNVEDDVRSLQGDVRSLERGR
jgi:DNA repair exonuclease SbcCD ATPase subunit